MARRIGVKALAHLCKQTAVSLSAGLTLSRAIPIITAGSKDPLLRRTMGEVNESITQGETLSAALRKRAGRFPPVFVEMVGAGERTGHLSETFQRLADYFDMRLRIRRGVIKASIYPAIQLTAAYSVGCLVLMILSSDRARTGSLIASFTISTMITIVAAYVFFARTSVGRSVWDRIVLALPVFRSLTIKLSMARFTRTLAMQLEGAIPVVEAVDSSASVAGNTVVVKSLKKIAPPIRQGTSLAEAVMSSRYVTPLIREVLEVGEETGNFGESLNRIAHIYEEEAVMVLESLPKFIGPAVAVIVGIVVIYLFYTVYIVNYINLLSG
jgi:type II secretory pathway component PulF